MLELETGYVLPSHLEDAYEDSGRVVKHQLAPPADSGRGRYEHSGSVDVYELEVPEI